jgi:hypothetical protein
MFKSGVLPKKALANCGKHATSTSSKIILDLFWSLKKKEHPTRVGKRIHQIDI